LFFGQFAIDPIRSFRVTAGTDRNANFLTELSEVSLQCASRHNCRSVFVALIEKILRHFQEITEYFSMNQFFQRMYVTGPHIVKQRFNDAN